MKRRLCLAVETSGKGTGVATADVASGEILAELIRPDRPPGEQPLVPMIDDVLVRTGASLDDLCVLACAIGPGSFTGLRVGLATLKGIALSCGDLPIVGISTLRALAESARVGDAMHDLVAPVQDARKGEVYAALFDTDRTLVAEGAYPPVVLAGQLASHRGDRRLVLTGDGIDLIRPHLAGDVFAEALLRPAEAPCPGAVALLAIKAHERGDHLPPDAGPRYHRLSEAEVHRSERDQG